MAVEEVLICEEIRDNLGAEGLKEVCACLWPVDCQTCGRFLGEDPPSLCVDDMMVSVSASLHHPACRAPEWNDSSHFSYSREANLSFVTAGVRMPARYGDHDTSLPMMLVNPGLEQVPLEHDGDRQRWRVRPSSCFTNAGLTTAKHGVELGQLIDGAIVRLTDDSVEVTLQVPPYQTYDCPAEQSFVDEARAFDGILLGVTHALNPHQVSFPVFDQALSQGLILTGKVAFHGAKRSAPASAPASNSATFVMHWNPRRMSVGRLLAHHPKTLVPRKARKWAESLLGADAEHLIGWEPVDAAHPEDGWFTLNALSVNMYFLRLHSDGWRLVQAMSRSDGRTVETDNEAKAWAGEVLKLKSHTSGLAWESGPSTPGSATLYATS
jgi:hypothetical protein